MSIDKTIIYKLEGHTTRETALKNMANDTLAKLKTRFGNEYAVTADAFGELGKDWSHEIKIRKGNKIGAAVTLKWEKSQPETVALEVDNSSKMGSQITYGTLLVFIAVGAYLGYNNMAPLEFLPGKKIAGGLGGLLFMIPGLILVAVLKSVLLKKEKAQNAQLVNEIWQFIGN